MLNEISEYSQQSYLVLWSAFMIIIGIITVLSLVTGVGTDTNFDADADFDAQVDGAGFVQSIYLFMNLGKVPVTLIFFVMITINWALCLLINMTINSAHNPLIGWSVFGVVIFLSIPITKVFCLPLKKFFASLLEDVEKQTHSIGSICTTTSEVNENNGTAQIKDGPNIVNLLVYCDKNETIARGTKALVIQKNSQLNRYLISTLEENF